MRTPLTSRSSGAANGEPDSEIEIGERGSGPARALNNSATSATLLAIGPSTLSVDHALTAGQTGTRPGDGRMPTTPQKLAGLRSDPPMSLPSATGSIRVASATAAPPLLPPQVLVLIVGIQRRAEHWIERLGTGAEFRRVRLADADRAGGANPFDQQRVFGRHEVGENRRAERRANALGRLEILVRDRKTVQRANGFVARERFIRRRGSRHRLLGYQRDDRVDLGVDAFDFGKMSADHVPRRQLLRPQKPGKIDGAVIANLGDHEFWNAESAEFAEFIMIRAVYFSVDSAISASIWLRTQGSRARP